MFFGRRDLKKQIYMLGLYVLFSLNNRLRTFAGANVSLNNDEGREAERHLLGKRLSCPVLYGSAVPDFDFTSATSLALMLPLALTSDLKFVASTG